MSESIMRKVQPFTIGTKLSAPPAPKCQSRFLPAEALDSCGFQHSLSSLYLSPTQVCTHDPRPSSPTVKPAAPTKREHVAGDVPHQNASSAAAVCRSIKKITISTEGRGKMTGGPARPPLTASSSENNNNNNNSSSFSEPQLPRIVGVSYESKPNSELKVLLSKDIHAVQGKARLKLSGENSVQIPAPERKNKDPEVSERWPLPRDEGQAAAAVQDDRFVQPNSLFTKEVLQAEAWIKGKLQDLKDGCDVQCCPVQDWEEASQTLQRDLKDFENNLIQLNQMGEQLICKPNPTSDAVKRQLSQLREQWQTLRQTAANRTRALAAAQSLQEFNRKVDQLEAWIKQKQEEEQQSLGSILGESVDKMHLTRRMLDLKQDEQQHRNLHEEINTLALKLEKLGKADSRTICSRRKLINKMWLKVQSHLKSYQENLHLALEVSSFHQQAEKVLSAMTSMRRSMSASEELDGVDHREIRDIAGQIMILDVTVSQLSKLHPSVAAGITRKQIEVKDSWALLQRVFRGDRAPLSPSGSTFTREDADPPTPDREPGCTVGAKTHAVMGKEVKEEQNRLKGCVEPCGNVTGPAGGQSHEQRSPTHTPSPAEGGSVCPKHGVMKQQPKGESRKPRAEPRLSAASRGHTQLQRFTVSADKTLSWLRDNVSMATQVCSAASSEGLEAARKRHRTLEEEILNHRARMEVVKTEGHGLVRAQHPGSARIEEFLRQLDVLWEELKRRHQRNAVFLQASTELGFRVVKVLQALGSLDAWLESVELSMKQSASAGDPETMSRAERESCLLEREVAARSPELSQLRREVERLHGHSHPHARRLPERMDALEEKYHRVLAALSQQSSELQDTRMLTEFLERVELEESQEHGGASGGFSLAQPLHSGVSSAPPLFELQSGGSVGPLMETMGDPVEELREAVEMLNDTVRKRSRSQSHDQAIQELMRKLASLAVRLEECLSSGKELRLDIVERETDMAVQCEPDRCGLEALQEKQDHLENAHGVISEEAREVKQQASQLKELCPERVLLLEARIQATLQAWAELGQSVAENRARLQEFSQLQDFFRSYLAMISWTEDTRSCIFSDSVLHLGKDGQRPLAAALDSQIQQRFEEFDALAITGKMLLDEEHHLAPMVRERMEELRSMLGWIAVHWRAQKQQWFHRRKPVQDNVYCEAAMGSPSSEAELQALWSLQAPRVRTNASRAEPLQPAEQHRRPSEDGYEVMNGVRAESPKTNVVVLKDSSPQQAVNLILSFGGGGDSQVQVLDLPGQTRAEAGEPFELAHRVSTYLRVKDSSLAVAPVYESITLPRRKGCPTPPVSPLSHSSDASGPQPTSAGLHPLTGGGGGGGFIFCSLKRRSKKRRRRRDARRHTIQRVMGVEERAAGMHHYECEAVTYDTRTWPLKEGGRTRSSLADSGGAEADMKNPDDSITPYAVSEGPSAAARTRTHCSVLSLGSVLSFDLPKDVTLLPSIQDVITIAPPEARRDGADVSLPPHRPAVLSSFKQSPDVGSSDPLQTPPPPDGDPSSPSSAQCDGAAQERHKTPSDPKSDPGLNVYVNNPRSAAAVTRKHLCLSVHTRVRDLNGHLYHTCAPSRCNRDQTAALQVSQASPLKLNPTAGAGLRQDSSVSSFTFGADVAPADNRPKGMLGKLLSLEECSQTPPESAEEEKERVHPNHQEFEEEEEELEDIWSQTPSYRQSVCSDIMYRPEQQAPVTEAVCSPAAQNRPLLYRDLLTASAPDLLMAERKLPPHIPDLFGSHKAWKAKDRLPPLATGDRRSWAAFPGGEPAAGTSATTNETAAETVKLPDVGDRHRYVYHYREEEEEEGQRGEELTGRLKDTPLSAASALPASDGAPRGELASTGGRRFVPGGEPELQPMEGTLERKQRLQPGGKKAASRGWTSCHAVLSGHAMHFFQDSSSACGPPLDLMGAECSPAPDYTKKPNCLRLGLRDGSQFLLSVSSHFMMKAWLTRLQASTGRGGASSSGAGHGVPTSKTKMRAAGTLQHPGVFLTPPSCREPSSSSSSWGCPDGARWLCSPPHGPPFPSVVLGPPQSQLRSWEGPPAVSSPGGCCHDDGRLPHGVTQQVSEAFRENASPPTHCPPSAGQDWLSGQSPSHSFTSSAYQRIQPTPPPPAGQGSGYCVTVVVGEKPSEGSWVRSGASPPPASHLRSFASPPRPSSKSVFRKFFGKKEL